MDLTCNSSTSASSEELGTTEGGIALSSPSVAGGYELETNDANKNATSILETPSSGPPESGKSGVALKSESAMIGNVQIHRARQRSERRSSKRITLWDLKTIKAGTDPMGQGIAMAFTKGAKSVLFLSITSPPAGCAAPHFTSSAAIAPTSLLLLWTGIIWDPTLAPEMWNLFVRAGYLELSPAGTATNIKSNRNVLRSAFGVQPGEYLLLARAGSANNCRGVLALISDKSLLTEISEALQILSTLPSRSKKIA